MTRIASTGILRCHTLIIIIEKDYIRINSWYELSVLPASIFIPKFRSQINDKILGKKKSIYKESHPFLKIWWFCEGCSVIIFIQIGPPATKRHKPVLQRTSLDV